MWLTLDWCPRFSVPAKIATVMALANLCFKRLTIKCDFTIDHPLKLFAQMKIKSLNSTVKKKERKHKEPNYIREALSTRSADKDLLQNA